MKSLLFIFLLCLSPLAKASRTISEYQIGYTEQVVLDTSKKYAAYGYDGDCPLMVKIWHPSKTKTQNELTIAGLLHFSAQQNLQTVQKAYYQHVYESIWNYGCSESLNDYSELNFDDSLKNRILSNIKNLQTKAHLETFHKKGEFPVIVYHHGNQGFPEENYLMAEYFASKGFVFIAANFHFPYPNTTFGSRPWAILEKYTYNESEIKSLIHFAKSLAGKKKVIFIGHSWGAQTGWTFLQNEPNIDAFISMETTIEFKTDENKIKELWPRVYSAIREQKIMLKIPVLAMATTLDNKPFPFFISSGNRISYSSPKVDISHESYTSVPFLRFLAMPEYNFPDNAGYKTQWKVYQELPQFIHAYLKYVLLDKKNKVTPAADNFFFTL
jgi:dienelactone hydrolase